MIDLIKRQRCGARTRGLALALSLAVAATGCKDILEVDNPNDLLEEDLDNPLSAGAIVNGASGTVARGIGAMLGPYSTASDEVIWIGSRDAWRELDQGFISNERNEFTDDAFRYFSQGRFMVDEAIKRLEAFDAAGQLVQRSMLAEVYLYGAIAYTTTADMFDTFVISERRDAGKPLEPSQMVTLYDQALAYVGKGLAIASAGTNIHTALLGMRARTEFAKAAWQKTKPSAAADPLVGSAAANAAAMEAFKAMSSDYRYVMTLANDDLAYAGEASLSYNLYQRGELNIAAIYGTRQGATNMVDPIDNVPSPVLARELSALSKAYVNQPITIVSAREMHLIMAEVALAQGNDAGFTMHVNHVREMDGLTPYDGQIPAREMLIHMRRTNLFLQGRRLMDHYRFKDPSAQWGSGSTAMERPTFFPVTCVEIRAHPDDFPGISC